ncbi:MAG: hypothetical protein HY791_06640 [Deltaproteobacteria bacterium]|nr:hypothetical protein [Deltaproteobacteria bacterium]
MKSRVASAKAASYADCYEATCQIELGRAVAASDSVSGKVVRLGKECTLILTIYDVLTSASTQGGLAKDECSAEGLLRAADSAVAQLNVERDPGCVLLPHTPPGFVTINSEPHSVVYYGDKKLGETPLAKIKLPSGCLKVRLENREANLRVDKVIKVDPGKTLRYQFDLSIQAVAIPPSQSPPVEWGALKERCWRAIRSVAARDPSLGARLKMAFGEAAAGENIAAMTVLLTRAEAALLLTPP